MVGQGAKSSAKLRGVRSVKTHIFLGKESQASVRSDYPGPPRSPRLSSVDSNRRGNERKSSISCSHSSLPRKRAERRSEARSMPGPGQAAERDERGRDDYEQQQARVLMALMQGFCAARYRKADNTPCPIEQVSPVVPSFVLSNSICFLRFCALCSTRTLSWIRGWH